MLATTWFMMQVSCNLVIALSYALECFAGYKRCVEFFKNSLGLRTSF